MLRSALLPTLLVLFTAPMVASANDRGTDGVERMSQALFVHVDEAMVPSDDRSWQAEEPPSLKMLEFVRAKIARLRPPKSVHPKSAYAQVSGYRHYRGC